MTPELRNACELVFQEHKTSDKPVTWTKDAFRGRLPFGLSAMAKEILISKNIIRFPNPEKKIITRLNPLAATASTFEDADELVQKGIPSFATSILDDQPAYIAKPAIHKAKHKNYLFVRIIAQLPDTIVRETKWHKKPMFYYLVLPACAAVGGAMIAWMIGFIFNIIFF